MSRPFLPKKFLDILKILQALKEPFSKSDLNGIIAEGHVSAAFSGFLIDNILEKNGEKYLLPSKANLEEIVSDWKNYQSTTKASDLKAKKKKILDILQDCRGGGTNGFLLNQFYKLYPSVGKWWFDKLVDEGICQISYPGNKREPIIALKSGIHFTQTLVNNCVAFENKRETQTIKVSTEKNSIYENELRVIREKLSSIDNKLEKIIIELNIK